MPSALRVVADEVRVRDQRGGEQQFHLLLRGLYNRTVQ